MSETQSYREPTVSPSRRALDELREASAHQVSASRETRARELSHRRRLGVILRTMPVVLGVVAAGLVALELTLGAEGWMGLTALACVAGAVGFGLASLAVKIPPRDGVDNGGHVVPPNHS